MKVLVAIDSFKGSLTSLEAGNLIKEGIKKADPKSNVIVKSLADGGEGTLEALVNANEGKIIHVKAHGPREKIIDSTYGYISSKKLAIIEMSKASGITLLKKNELNPLYTTTYGVGELINDALKKGAKHFIVAIGGSATNDGGVGMLIALGYRFLDKNNHPIKLGAVGLKDLAKIDNSKVNPKLKFADFLVASDVKNPLCGKYGCSNVFGPQKGATKKMICDMDKWINHYAELTNKLLKHDYSNEHGAGAAGGLGFALISYLSAKLRPGVDIVLEHANFAKDIKNADLVITGEGRLDAQTAMGKAPIGVAKLAKKFNKQVIAFGGGVTKDACVINKHGIDAFFSILNEPITLEQAMNKKVASDNLRRVSEQVFRLVRGK